MKKIKYFVLGALALTGLAACTSDNLADGQDPTPGAEDVGYLAINVLADNGTTRATATFQDYEDGTTDESAISSVLCLFYDAQGNYVTYRSFTPTVKAPTQAESDITIEKVTQSQVVLQGKQLAARQMLVIINPSTNALSDMQAITKIELAKQKVNAYGQKVQTNGFMMTNSVYQNGNGEDQCQVTFDASYIKDKPEDAVNKPVVAYVERNLAKVNITCNNVTLNPTTQNMFNTVTGDMAAGSDIQIKPYVVSIQSLPAKVVVTTQQSYLFKSLKDLVTTKKGWSSAWQTGWNSTSYHRCFWAYTPDMLPGTSDSNFGNYILHSELFDKSGNVLTNLSFANGTNLGSVDPTYIQENTNQDDANTTKVMVVAQLRDNDGNPLDIVNTNGNYYTYPVFCKWLAYRINTMFQDAQGQNITVFADVNNGAESHFTCKRKSGGKQWEYRMELADANSITVLNDVQKTAVADFLKEFDGWRWQGGMCYYYADILQDITKDVTVKKADGTTTTEQKCIPGVVRNHIYNMNIQSISGLGTPIFPNPDEPDEPIVPEKPTDESWYLAAKINTLKWRVVSQNVNLGE